MILVFLEQIQKSIKVKDESCSINKTKNNCECNTKYTYTYKWRLKPWKEYNL